MSRPPIAVAITGSIGAGKSEALQSFARQGAATVSSDEIVHELLRADDEVRTAMRERFGDEIFRSDGDIDRATVAERVFANRDDLDFLEQLLHPRVAREYLRWREWLATLPEPPDVCVTEVPLLYESGGDKHFDKVVVVTAPLGLRKARSGGMLEQREGRLLPDRDKIKRADFSYVNDGTVEELDAFVSGVLKQLTA